MAEESSNHCQQVATFVEPNASTFENALREKHWYESWPVRLAPIGTFGILIVGHVQMPGTVGSWRGKQKGWKGELKSGARHGNVRRPKRAFLPKLPSVVSISTDRNMLKSTSPCATFASLHESRVSCKTAVERSNSGLTGPRLRGVSSGRVDYAFNDQLSLAEAGTLLVICTVIGRSHWCVMVQCRCAASGPSRRPTIPYCTSYAAGQRRGREVLHIIFGSKYPFARPKDQGNQPARHQSARRSTCMRTVRRERV
jgi:hypothetical protein